MFPLKLSDAATLVQALTSIIYKYDMYLSVSFSCHREEKPLKLYYVEIRLMKGSQFYSWIWFPFSSFYLNFMLGSGFYQLNYIWIEKHIELKKQNNARLMDQIFF